jgi:hypothetical protein
MYRAVSEIEGTVVAGYRLEALVGRGGMGVMCRATQLDLDRASPWVIAALSCWGRRGAEPLRAGVARPRPRSTTRTSSRSTRRARRTAHAIESRWRMRGARRWNVLFPSGCLARIVAVRRDGSPVQVGRRVPVRDVACLRVDSERAGYVVVPLRRAGVVARTIRTRRQPSAPMRDRRFALRVRGPRIAVRLRLFACLP